MEFRNLMSVLIFLLTFNCIGCAVAEVDSHQELLSASGGLTIRLDNRANMPKKVTLGDEFSVQIVLTSTAHPSGAELISARRWVAQLDSEVFEKRQQASTALKSLIRIPGSLLWAPWLEKEIGKGHSGEVSKRLRVIQKELKNRCKASDKGLSFAHLPMLGDGLTFQHEELVKGVWKVLPMPIHRFVHFPRSKCTLDPKKSIELKLGFSAWQPVSRALRVRVVYSAPMSVLISGRTYRGRIASPWVRYAVESNPAIPKSLKEVVPKDWVVSCMFRESSPSGWLASESDRNALNPFSERFSEKDDSSLPHSVYLVKKSSYDPENHIPFKSIVSITLMPLSYVGKPDKNSKTHALALGEKGQKKFFGWAETDEGKSLLNKIHKTLSTELP